MGLAPFLAPFCIDIDRTSTVYCTCTTVIHVWRVSCDNVTTVFVTVVCKQMCGPESRVEGERVNV